MANTRQFFMTAYDVASPRRLRKALTIIRGYATGGQKSAYECFLNCPEREAMMGEISRALCEEKDAFLLIRLDPRARMIPLGKANIVRNDNFFYIG